MKRAGRRCTERGSKCASGATEVVRSNEVAHIKELQARAKRWKETIQGMGVIVRSRQRSDDAQEQDRVVPVMSNVTEDIRLRAGR